MKRTLFSLLAISALAVAAVTAALAQTPQPIPRHLDPTVVSIGKEPPRGDVVSHDTRDEALRRTYSASKYLQPLTEWTKTETAEAETYKTRFKVPFEWIDREQFLYLGRVSASFDVVINGVLAGYSQTGSTPSEFDITRAAKEGANDLEIIIYKNPIAAKLENSRPVVPPQIEGEVYILSQPRMRVRDIFISTRMEGTDGLLELGVIMKSHQLNAREYTVYYELISPRGEILTEGHREATLDMRREDTVRFFAKIPRITPWSHEEPRLYTLFVKTQHEGRFKEHLSFRVGFRSLDVRDGVILLGGTPLGLTIRDFTPTGDIPAMRTGIEKLRAEGVNTLRLNGAPPSREFYALCDEMGVYLSGQADIDTRLSGPSRKIDGNPSNDPEWEGAYLDRVTSMYHTSKNSPSMVMFSLAEDAANGYNLYESYLALKMLELHRPVLYADGGGEWNTDRLDPDAMAALETGSVTPGTEWATLTATDAQHGKFHVRNTRWFTTLTGEAAYKIIVGKKTVSQGAIPLEIPPQGEADFTVPVTGVKEGKNFTIQVEVCIERPVNKYVPGESDTSVGISGVTGRGERRVFRDLDAAIAEEDKLTIARGDFPSVEPFSPATLPAAISVTVTQPAAAR